MSNDITLQLGDIIEILSPEDQNLHQHKYLIDYIDNTQIRLLKPTHTPEILIIQEGRFQNESIQSINVLYREASPSYAVQHNLTPNTWIDIYFNQDIPLVVTGKILNLDNDQIEVETTQNGNIYIDFEYKGLPLHLSIDKINRRSAPIANENNDILQETKKEEMETTPMETIALDEIPELEQESTVQPVGNIFIDADELKFGTELEEITQLVELPKEQQRYGIDKQTDDMLDECLATIPTANRTNKVLNEIHTLIERYQQLRSEYSLFENNSITLIKRGADHKPLVQSIQEFNKTLYWMIPVVNLRRKLYDVNEEEELDDDVDSTTIADALMKDKTQLSDIPPGDNKYHKLLQALKLRSTPYVEVDKTQKLNTNIIGIVDNQDDYYSKACNGKGELHRKKFLTQQFCKGDYTYIKSIIVLPEPVIHFSHINLPSTTIHERSNLNLEFLQYWKIFSKNTVINKKIVETSNKTLINGITEYIKGDEDFFEKLVPRTRDLFETAKSNMTPYSIHGVLYCLEPFLIYHKDITFKQYEDMTKYIETQIKDYKKRFLKNLDSLKTIVVASGKYENTIFKDLPEIQEKYKLENSDSLYNTVNIDHLRLLHAALAKKNVSLMIAEQLIRQPSNTNLNENKRSKYTLSKQYLTFEELQEDNNEVVYFDKQYDKTYYDLFDEYKTQLNTLTEFNDKLDFLTTKLIEVNGFPEKKAIQEADAMLSRRRKVYDDDIALLDDEIYRRKDNLWVKDDTIQQDDLEDSPKILCIPRVNENVINEQTKIKDKNIQRVLDEFDSSLKTNREEITKTIDREYEIAYSRIDKLKYIQQQKLLDIEMMKIAGDRQLVEIVESPYEAMRDSILGQNDFAKRQSDIIKFVMNHTRPATADEDKWWFYCVHTNTKLLPTFIHRLATVFINGDDYLKEIAIICANQGTISDDDAWWVDEHSGYNIVPISFSIDEGYTEEGFKNITREVMPDEKKMETEELFDNPHAKMISNVINAMSTFMGVNLMDHSNFMIQETMGLLEKVVMSREKYDKYVELAHKKGKKRIDTYETIHNQQLMSLTLGFIVVIIQTSIPSIKTRKQHPGCIRSFKGFPLGSEEDMTGITYVACVAHKIKNKIKPWDSIMRIKEPDLVKRINNDIVNGILKLDVVKERLVKKREFLSGNKMDDDIVQVHMDEWTTFLPSLNPIKLGTVQNISEQFNKQLKESLTKGTSLQHESINIIRGKISLFALKIQQCIQDVVSKHSAILSNNAGQIYLENACCDESLPRTLSFFIKHAPSIQTENNQALHLENTLLDLTKMAKASILFDNTDTKPIRAYINIGFNEETVYRAFINKCKYNTNIPLSENIRAICKEKPENYSSQDSIDESIRKLKRDGYNFTTENLDQLMNIVNNQNIISQDYSHKVAHNIQSLRNSINDMNMTDIDTFPPLYFRDLFDSMLDTYDIGGLMEDTPEMRRMKNYLDKSIEKMQNEFPMCVELFDFLETGDNAYIDSADETVFKMSHFANNCIFNLVKVFPNIIINNINYDAPVIPKHWKLSNLHETDLNKVFQQHYNGFKKYYNDDKLKRILVTMQESTKHIYELSNKTFYFAPIQVGGQEIYSIFDKRMCEMLFKYYLYSVFMEYIKAIEYEITNFGDMDVIEGEKLQLIETIRSLLNDLCEILMKNKNYINYNYDTMMERIMRAKVKEKDNITYELKEMSDEEREVQNLFKTHKLGKWGKGLQKGLITYQAETYEEERNEMDKVAKRDALLNANPQAQDANRNIYEMDMIAEENEAERIEKEENMIMTMGEDDDFGEFDGDEFFY